LRKRTLAVTAALMLISACSAGDTDDGSRLAQESKPDGAAGPETGPEIEGPNLQAVLDFANPSRCEWGAPAETIFGQKAVFDDNDQLQPGTIKIPGVADPVTATLSRPDEEYPDYVEADLDFKGEWLGLQVVGLTDAFFEESGGMFGRGIRFDAPIAEVSSALIEAGFEVNADGSERAFAPDRPDQPVDPDELMGEDFVSTSITVQGSETVFLCNYVFAGI